MTVRLNRCRLRFATPPTPLRWQIRAPWRMNRWWEALDIPRLPLKNPPTANTALRLSVLTEPPPKILARNTLYRAAGSRQTKWVIFKRLRCMTGWLALNIPLTLNVIRVLPKEVVSLPTFLMVALTFIAVRAQNLSFRALITEWVSPLRLPGLALGPTLPIKVTLALPTPTIKLPRPLGKRPRIILKVEILTPPPTWTSNIMWYMLSPKCSLWDPKQTLLGRTPLKTIPPTKPFWLHPLLRHRPTLDRETVNRVVQCVVPLLAFLMNSTHLSRGWELKVPQAQLLRIK